MSKHLDDLVAHAKGIAIDLQSACDQVIGEVSGTSGFDSCTALSSKIGMDLLGYFEWVPVKGTAMEEGKVNPEELAIRELNSIIRPQDGPRAQNEHKIWYQHVVNCAPAHVRDAADKIVSGIRKPAKGDNVAEESRKALEKARAAARTNEQISYIQGYIEAIDDPRKLARLQLDTNLAQKNTERLRSWLPLNIWAPYIKEAARRASKEIGGKWQAICFEMEREKERYSKECAEKGFKREFKNFEARLLAHLEAELNKHFPAERKEQPQEKLYDYEADLKRIESGLASLAKNKMIDLIKKTDILRELREYCEAASASATAEEDADQPTAKSAEPLPAHVPTETSSVEEKPEEGKPEEKPEEKPEAAKPASKAAKRMRLAAMAETVPSPDEQP